MGLFDEVRCRVYDSVEVAAEEREWVIDGHVPGEEDLLLLLLTSIGLRRAAEVVGPRLWRSAAAPERWATGRGKALRRRPQS